MCLIMMLTLLAKAEHSMNWILCVVVGLIPVILQFNVSKAIPPMRSVYYGSRMANLYHLPIACTAATNDVIKDICMRSLYSCKDACYATPLGPCGCDPLCMVYGDCCHDFEQMCPKLNKYKSRALEMDLHSVCLEGGERFITGCEKYPSISEPKSQDLEMCTQKSTGIHYLTQTVMEDCNIFYGEKTCLLWKRTITSRTELDLNGISKKLRKKNFRKWRNNHGFYKPRLCVKHSSLLEDLADTQFQRCKEEVMEMKSSHCHDDVMLGGYDNKLFNLNMTQLEVFVLNLTTGFQNLNSEEYEVKDESKMMYTFVVENQEQESMDLVVSAENSPKKNKFWERITCQDENAENSGNLDINDVIKSSIHCQISQCVLGYFYVSNMCLKPEMLVISIQTKSEDEFSKQKKMIRIAAKKVPLMSQTTFVLESLGERVDRFDNNNSLALRYRSHYSILKVLEPDRSKTLSISKVIHWEIVNSFERDSHIPNVTVCIYFPFEFSLLKRCDNISFHGIESAALQYFPRAEKEENRTSYSTIGPNMERNSVSGGGDGASGGGGGGAQVFLSSHLLVVFVFVLAPFMTEYL